MVVRMKSVVYAGLTFLTGDEIADALLQLAAALGQNDRAETVEIPVITDDGVPSSVQLVIGPASQFMSRPVESAFEDPASKETLDHLRHRLRLLELPKASAVSSSDVERFDFDNPV
jgi:hypothetical protein